MKKTIEITRKQVKEMVTAAMKDEPDYWKEMLKNKKLSIDDVVDAIMVTAEARAIPSFMKPLIFELLYDSDLLEQAEKAKPTKAKV